MQQVVILNYTLGRIDVYTLDQEDPEDFVDSLNIKGSDYYWLAMDGIIPIEIHK